MKKEKYCYDLMKEWVLVKGERKTEFYYPQKGVFYPYGFIKKHSGSVDLMDFKGLYIVANVEAEETMKVTVGFADGRHLDCRIPIVPGKSKKIRVSFEDFPIETIKESVWRYVNQIQFETDAEIISCRLQRREYLYVDFPVKGKSAGLDETVVYEGCVYNCSTEPIVVTASQLYEGWESMVAEVCWKQPEDTGTIHLEPGESRCLSVSLRVHNYMVPGGHEKTVIRFRIQGNGTDEETLELRTMRRLNHPYIYHDTAGWKQVMNKIEKYEMYRPAWEDYLKEAENWIVTDPEEGTDYCYKMRTEDGVMATAYCYALTGDERYADKLVDFFWRFSDMERGYPLKKKACDRSYVQEGHFFQHIAIAYDIVYDYKGMNDQIRDAMEYSLRLYMEMLDSDIRSGHISNWIVSEVLGAIYSAMVLQDADRIERFVFGNGGNLEQFKRGIFNDGWWFECSIGYNTWVSSMMIHMAHALKNFGYDIVHQKFAVPFNQEVQSSYALQQPEVQFGMEKKKYGGNLYRAVGFQDMFDTVLAFQDYRGVMFGVADSTESKQGGTHWGSVYDLAYTYYGNPEYIPIIQREKYKDPVFGNPLIPKVEASRYKENAYSDNIGIAMLRSQKKGREQSEQIQAVLRYGSHGGAHGHFDIGNLVSVMRYGRSFYNPEHCWWGYAHFLYKFYVQCSLTKNMVVVDEKMQESADSKRILFYEGNDFQAAGIEVVTRWSYPPYGGMVYRQDGQANTKDDLRERSRMNSSYLPIVEDDQIVKYGEMTGYTEPVVQKRIMVVADDYIVLFDYLQGEEEHVYDSLMQIKGFNGIEGENVKYTHHTEQMNDNPLSDAQFITDCSWYESKSPTVAHFETMFTEEMADGKHRSGDRSSYNEPGILKMDVHTAWPKQTQQMIGRVAVSCHRPSERAYYTVPMAYRVEADGECVEQGAFDAWILGRGECDLDVKGVQRLRLAVKETSNKEYGSQALFWGRADIILDDGRVVPLSELNYVTENINPGMGVGRDYKGGRVTIVGTEYPNAIPASPQDPDKEGYIDIDLRGMNAVRFIGCIGCDAFPGDEWQRRKTYAVRSRGKRADYVTIVEPYETENVIVKSEAEGPGQVKVTLKDGREQIFKVTGIEDDTPSVTMETWVNSQRVSAETTCVGGVCS